MASTLNLSAGDRYEMPYGYYAEPITITSTALSTLTPGTANASRVLNGYTAWVNGSKITGNIPIRTASDLIVT